MAPAAEVGRCDAALDVVSFGSIPEHPPPRRSLSTGAAHPPRLVACLGQAAPAFCVVGIHSFMVHSLRFDDHSRSISTVSDSPPPLRTVHIPTQRPRRTISVSVVGCDFASTNLGRRLRLCQRARGQDDTDVVVHGQQHEVDVLDVFPLRQAKMVYGTGTKRPVVLGQLRLLFAHLSCLTMPAWLRSPRFLASRANTVLCALEKHRYLHHRRRTRQAFCRGALDPDSGASS
ncbi:hypothetical protein MSAN_02523600 [Mycena sanguinolenta]|uniref:Uncharacterized protein n=1 Tax=Mycena sanguinolenta TaxID=230812 RepID=A0A8H6TX66_9AGAR|nr:hypothetical protein MSAN_02523600 [Mycena sanguinolenta]